MSLLINQGKQKVEDDGIIVVNDAICKIEKVKLHPTLGGALLVSFKIINGAFKNRMFSDTINYEPSHSMAWKYTHLRKCAGVPYKEGEAEKVDIEKMLVGKCVQCDLSKRLDKNGNEWQNVKYKPLAPNPSDVTVAPSATTKDVAKTDTSDDEVWSDMEPVEDVKRDEDLPF